MRRTPTANTLFYGDNLTILRNHIEDESVDLIYLDPPFNSNASYNVLFRAPTGEQSQAQIEAFDDTWHWTESAERAFDETVNGPNSDASNILLAMERFLGKNDMMAYLAMMAARLLELHRVLKPTGSLYLHCDPTASHYLKVLLDAVFGVDSFRNEITWKRSTSHGNVGRNYGSLSDAIFFYSKTDRYTWNQQFARLSEDYVEAKFTNRDEGGRRWQSVSLRNPSVRPNLQFSYTASNGVTYKPHPNGWAVGRERLEQYDREGRLHYPKKSDGQLRVKQYLDERPGTRLQNIWDDIPAINSQAQERLGYPTQKPLALLERIIAASSKEGDLVLDPFCGCGTTVHAAQKLNRRWIGIDVTHLAVSLMRRRLIDAFPTAQFYVEGVPKDLGAAEELARADKHQFELWALSMVEAQPFKGGRKGADTGIDGLIYFKPDGKTTEKAIVEVKGGQNVNVDVVHKLISVVEREKAKFGILISLVEPTSAAQAEAIKAGLYKHDLHRPSGYPRIQILTVKDLFDGRGPDMPWIDASVFRKARREADRQGELDV